ncbi:hypothetical protein LIER_16712 [Lithospermum erythrorhizon]|uniref:Uncharacterized protein n=1 Tax=Lithospermum erythrorhizon TaxID=34254 RepID=A0AAV3Q809_LITER
MTLYKRDTDSKLSIILAFDLGDEERCDLRELTSRKALQWLLSRSIVECTCPQWSYFSMVYLTVLYFFRFHV